MEKQHSGGGKTVLIMVVHIFSGSQGGSFYPRAPVRVPLRMNLDALRVIVACRTRSGCVRCKCALLRDVAIIEAILATQTFRSHVCDGSAALKQLDRECLQVLRLGFIAGFARLSFVNREARRWLPSWLRESGGSFGARVRKPKWLAVALRSRIVNSEVELLGPWSTLESSGLSKRWRMRGLLAIYEGNNELNALDVYKKALCDELMQGRCLTEKHASDRQSEGAGRRNVAPVGLRS